MQVKVLEVRDRHTYFAVVCVDMNPDIDAISVRSPKPRERIEERRASYAAQLHHLRMRGYPCDGRPNIAMFHINCDGGPVWNDPYGWQARDVSLRTYPVAHKHIIEHWATLKDGDVIDVEFILGETLEKKRPERLEEPG